MTKKVRLPSVVTMQGCLLMTIFAAFAIRLAGNFRAGINRHEAGWSDVVADGVAFQPLVLGVGASNLPFSR